ncbi:MAG: outer membrane beta-barrel protein [Vicinamibacterales bacterium]|jgi:hypothetical protein|nr:outer membrane beta-barrel protein [Vicinamibacterales bacterium]MDP6610025.1 outer membrane beta-barrel protein [Vicinamibacterales bacterium]HAK54950.1 hypothetical protein [Acidobacteriota bacterium]|tara:strand:+ start:1647 stop:2180 length:534 start_codon:yes stop_codon:yes gene_type:complete
MPLHRLAPLVLVLSLLVPVSASADGLFSPYIGSAMSQTTWGFSLAGMGRELVGFEFDLGYTPDFFVDEEPESDNNLLTLMGSVIIGAPAGPVRPYVVGGMGLMRSRIAGPSDLIEFSRNDLGINLGGGLYGFFGETFGIRGDVRYLRSLSDGGEGILDFDLGDFSFWRTSVGVVFRF